MAVQASAAAAGSSRVPASATLSTVAPPDAVVTSNHASQTSRTALTIWAVPFHGRRRASAHPVATRLTSSITSNPTQATFQWFAT